MSKPAANHFHLETGQIQNTLAGNAIIDKGKITDWLLNQATGFGFIQIAQMNGLGVDQLA